MGCQFARTLDQWTFTKTSETAAPLQTLTQTHTMPRLVILLPAVLSFPNMTLSKAGILPGVLLLRHYSNKTSWRAVFTFERWFSVLE